MAWQPAPSHNAMRKRQSVIGKLPLQALREW